MLYWRACFLLADNCIDTVSLSFRLQKCIEINYRVLFVFGNDFDGKIRVGPIEVV